VILKSFKNNDFYQHLIVLTFVQFLMLGRSHQKKIYLQTLHHCPLSHCSLTMFNLENWLLFYHVGPVHQIENFNPLRIFPPVAKSAGLSSDEKCLKSTPLSHLISFSLLVINTDSGFWTEVNVTHALNQCICHLQVSNLRTHTPITTSTSSNLGIVRSEFGLLCMNLITANADK